MLRCQPASLKLRAYCLLLNLRRKLSLLNLRRKLSLIIYVVNLGVDALLSGLEFRYLDIFASFLLFVVHFTVENVEYFIRREFGCAHQGLGQCPRKTALPCT